MSEGVQTRRWTRAEYDRLIETGVFQPGDRVELLGAELVVAEPQSEPHVTAIGLIEDAPRSAAAARALAGSDRAGRRLGARARHRGRARHAARRQARAPGPTGARRRGRGDERRSRPHARGQSVRARGAHRRLDSRVGRARGADATVAPRAAPEARVRVSDLLP